MLGYEHPFYNGNGRTARALFHWAMLHAGFPFYEYLPVSRSIQRAKAQYERTYLHVETDRFDLTYFLHFQLRMVLRTLAESIAYLEKQRREHRGFIQGLSRASEFNHRQRVLLKRAVERPETVFTVHSHSVSQMVTQPTARKDLEELEARGFLVADRSTRSHSWVAPPNLKKRLAGRSRNSVRKPAS
jgi:Fic family protein